jgi:hypothetical protein
VDWLIGWNRVYQLVPDLKGRERGRRAEAGTLSSLGLTLYSFMFPTHPLYTS